MIKLRNKEKTRSAGFGVRLFAHTTRYKGKKNEKTRKIKKTESWQESRALASPHSRCAISAQGGGAGQLVEAFSPLRRTSHGALKRIPRGLPHSMRIRRVRRESERDTAQPRELVEIRVRLFPRLSLV